MTRRPMLLALSLLAALTGCGRGEKKAAHDVSQLQITRYRYNIDEAHQIARIVAEITNFGDAPVRSAVVTATLRGPDGSARGQNSTTVDHIKPGEPKTFSMHVTTHGRERDIDFHISTEHQAELAAQNANPEGSPANAHE